MVYIPQKRIPDDVIRLIRDLRSKGLTYVKIHEETGVSVGKIAETCGPLRSELHDQVERLERRLNEATTKMMNEDDVRRLILLSLQGTDVCCTVCSDGVVRYFERDGEQGFVCSTCHHEILL